MPRVMLSQARIHGLMLKAMEEFNGQEVDYGYKVLEVNVDEEKADEPDSYPVTIVTEKEGKEEIFKAKYALVHLSVSIKSFCNLNDGRITVSRAAMGHTVLFESR